MAWSRISGGFVLQQGTHGRHGFAGPRAEVADGGEERGPDLGVGVVQAGRQLRHGARGQRANLSQRQGRAAADARLRGLDRLREQLDGRPADLGQGLGDLIDAALLATEGVEQPGGGVRADLAEQERGVARDAVVLPPSRATRAPAPGAGATPVARRAGRPPPAGRVRPRAGGSP